MSDVEIRQALKTCGLAPWDSEPGAVVLDEMGIEGGRAIVDVVVVAGALHGFEIKAGCDTLARLPSQALRYGRVLDFATLVADPVHIEAARKLLPAWWGLCVPRRPDDRIVGFDHLRRPLPSPAIEPACVVRLLWRHEVLAALGPLGLDRDVRRLPKARLARLLLERLGLTELRSVVRSALRSRPGWKVDAVRNPRPGPGSGGIPLAGQSALA